MITIHFHRVTFASHTTKDSLKLLVLHARTQNRHPGGAHRILPVRHHHLELQTFLKMSCSYTVRRSFYASRITSEQVYTTQCNVLVFGAGMFVMNLGDRQMCKNACVKKVWKWVFFLIHPFIFSFVICFVSLPTHNPHLQ